MGKSNCQLTMAGDPKCGSKSCWTAILVIFAILLVVGVIFLVLLVTGTPDCPDGSSCEGCYDNDSEKALQELCCNGESRSCDEARFFFFGGLALAIVGAILTSLACCGVMACCCCQGHGAKGAPVVAVKGAAPKADEIVE